MERFTGNTRDNQEVLDYVFTQFYVNKAPMCGKPGQACFYKPRNTTEIGCHVGCLLTDEQQRKWNTIGSWVEHVLLDEPETYDEVFDRLQIDFLRDLQSMHDGGHSRNISQWEWLAELYDLTLPSVHP